MTQKWLAIFLLLLPLILLSTDVFAETMTLLAVSETENGLRGNTATLGVELVPGTGRVFLETATSTQVDTQLSTRLAKQTVCDRIDISCNQYDFIYTIHSDASIVGGPSAGAAMALLTASLLEEKPLPKDLSITGTINAGGIIGPVGGVQQKIEAASDARISTVLIPLGEGQQESMNQTIDLISYGAQLNVTVIEVATLEEALAHARGETYEPIEVNVSDAAFSAIMEEVAFGLCERSELLRQDAPEVNISDTLESAERARASGEFYTAASRCFSANVQLTSAINAGVDDDVLFAKQDRLEREMDAFSLVLENRTIPTFSDLQTLMIVKERLSEAVFLLNQSREEESTAHFAFAQERFASAEAWSAFFGKEGRPIDLHEDRLRESCNDKLSQAEDRINYAEALLERSIDDLTEDALHARSQQDYALCLHQASLAKAKVDTLLGTLGVSADRAGELVDIKLRIARQSMAEEQARGYFPIAAFAYAEYAESLKEDDPGSALLYAQYAMELSSFDAFFPEEEVIVGPRGIQGTNYEFLIIYLVGIFSGILIAYISWQV